jgi:hypothetical protein
MIPTSRTNRHRPRPIMFHHGRGGNADEAARHCGEMAKAERGL